MLPSDAAASIVNDPRNTANLDDLYGALQGQGIIPFVGAGLSRPFGFPEWGGFLRAQASTAGASAAIDARLAKGEYEEAASALQDALGALAFEDAIRRTFGKRDLARVAPDAAVRSLPALAAGPVLTTNFDHVLESVFDYAGRRFDQIVCGAPRDQVAQALHVNARLLWKLHGDGDYGSSADRVLTHTEYAEHYGDADPAQFDWRKPLPALFENLLVARPLLFLGSSLDQDRTVRVLQAFSRRHRGVGHYALLSDPGVETARLAQARALSNVGIRPLWFPTGRFELIGPFLHYLAGCVADRGNKADIASQQARIQQGIDAERQFLAVAAPGADGPQRVVGERPLDLKGFRGRSAELQEIGEHLTSAVTRVVSLVGPSGMGKTALAVRLLSDLEQNRWPPQIEGRTVDGIAYLSTRTGGITFERLFLACARMLGGSPRADLERDWKKDQLTVDDKIDRLLEAMRGGLYVILLDHIEDLLDPDGVVTDPEIRKLVERTLTAPSGARLLVTSGMQPALSGKASQPVRLKAGLSIDDGIAMLRDRDQHGSAGLRDLPDVELERIVTRLHGVPRALEVFAGILTYDAEENVDQLLERFYQREDVIQDLFKEGVERLDGPSRSVVEALAVLSQPVSSAAVDFLLQPFLPGLDVPATLRKLGRSQIVQLTDRVKKTWSLQPIDQDFAYAHCPETGRYSRQTLHQRAAEWYASVRTPRESWNTLEGLEPLLREFDHRVKAGLYDDAGAVLAEFDEVFSGRVGQASRSLVMHNQIEGRVTIERVRLLNTFGLAHAYRHLGPVDTAIKCYRGALEMARAQQNSDIEIDSLGWIGEAFRRLQRLDDAADSAKQAVAVAKQAGSRTLAARWLGELALVSCYQGHLNDALAYAEEAHQTAVEANDINWQALAVDGLALVHLMRGDLEKSIAAAEQAIKAYQQGTWEHTVIYVLNVEGLAYLEQRQVDRAIDCLDRAYREARIVEDIRVEGMTRVNLAHAWRIKGDMAQALQHAEDAVAIFTRTQGGELEPARALTDALRANAAGLAAAEARALVKVAQESMSNPDLLNPRAFLPDAIALAQRASRPEIAADGERLAAAIRARAGTQLA
jgi:tetratricopeptide (TPR) repeat protein